jgi:hypothetical protein
MKIRCRDASKVPTERLFYINKKLYKMSIIVESVSDQNMEQIEEKDGEGGGGSNQDKGNMDKYMDDFNDVDNLDEEEPGGSDRQKDKTGLHMKGGECAHE